ncbi:transporter substrate-binding domain-containing protein [Marinobacter sp. CHS3-4]|uniref:substrate-binding periplasmic protein n=1 Tax=Marinobacter sp. CHS3-4 TaxID=3045174 RepID=UPI0024B4E98A|nr:transporter substrate-binding domain-containing protein [Marinobacter sp. CHS3-4]MDI9246358.1 transporter substrate-binding domain-containing protein [Marinobacter sp. CHS3-4]
MSGQKAPLRDESAMALSIQRGIRSALLVALIISGLSLSAFADDEPDERPLVFCNSHWPPFSYGGPSGEALGGYAVRFLQEISARTQIPMDLKILPWRRCLFFARQGEVDGIMMLTRNREREAFLTMTNALLSDSNLLWYRKDSEFVADRLSFEDLQGMTIGLTSGFNYGDAFARASEQLGLDTEESPTILSNFRKLDLGRVDVFLVNKVVAEYSLKADPLLRARFTLRQGPFPPVGFHIGLAKNGQGIRHLKAFNDAISDMAALGVIETILNEDPLPSASGS